MRELQNLVPQFMQDVPLRAPATQTSHPAGVRSPTLGRKPRGETPCWGCTPALHAQT